jgi:MFS superfamily sulfate permease-like transporter
MGKQAPELTFKYLKEDLPAGLVVFLVALPLCLGIALASGAPLFSGIIAGIVGGIVVALASGSNVSVTGPAAGLTVIVLNGINDLGNYNFFLLAVVLAGIVQIILGYLKAGVIGYYFHFNFKTSTNCRWICKRICNALSYHVYSNFKYFNCYHFNMGFTIC